MASPGDQGDARIPQMEYVDSPELSQLHAKCHHNLGDSFELSLQDGIHESPNSPIKLCASFQSELPPQASDSFELPIPPLPLPRSENAHLLQSIPKTQLFQVEGDYEKLLRDYESQKMEMVEMRSMLDELKAENEAKTRECEEACKSLHDLRSELMTKSMHVGSLAFAIEGQITEKSKWFSTLRDFTRKLKIMKLENIKLAEEAYAYKKFAEEMSSSIRSAVNQQACMDEHLKRKFVEGAEERKELYNKVLELKGNIRVFCRCRPLNAEEIASGASVVADFESAKDGELGVRANGLGKKNFKFDAVFCPQADQVDVFKDTAPFATSILDGYNVCIFAYGQTGTGKTFTMEGTEEERGVNFRILEEMFCVINERQKLYKYSVSVSVLEVYNEQIRDLLASGTQAASTKRLEIRQLGEGTHYVPGLIEANVSNINEVWEVLQTGSNARAVGSTNVNEHSSRSHCIHCVMVKGENLLNGECTKSKLWLVDLAGSERVAKTEVQGERLRETQNINRSLSALGDVISALATKSPHIPFRNSKLTHLLQDSLGGDSKTLMFVQISPNERDLGETICSLNFASRAEKSKLDTKSKDVQMKKMEETVHGLELKLKEKDIKNKGLQDKVKELESQLLVERKLARQHVDTKIAEQHQQQQMKHQQEEQNLPAIRSPLGNRPLGTLRNVNDALANDRMNAIQSLLEKNSYKHQVAICATNEFAKYIDPTEKENNPEMLEQSFLPRRTGRASICPLPRRIPATCAPRRNSLIPFPSTPNTTQIPLHFLPLAPIPADERDDLRDEPEVNCLPKQTACDSPRISRNGARKLSSVLRRSLHKKFLRKSPVMKKGVSVGGTEKLRVSIGNRGRLLGNARRPAGLKVTTQKPSHKDKERGWNIGRTVA